MFIVVYDDGMTGCCPMGWDLECAGAIEAHGRSVALFPDKPGARKAIRISKFNALLRREQGLAYNDDFVLTPQHIKILPAKFQV